MKKISSVISLSFSVVFLLVFSFPSVCFSAQPDSKEWESFDKGWYYNKKNVTKSSNIITVWTYSIVTDDVRKKRIDSLNQQEESKKYRHFDHFTLLNKFDCQKRMTKLEEVIDYDDNGKVLSRIINKDSQWGYIVPQSTTQTLYEKLCVTPMKPLKKK